MYTVLHFHKVGVNICQMHLHGLVKTFWEVLVYILYMFNDHTFLQIHIN
jgi:hypothetical protein